VLRLTRLAIAWVALGAVQGPALAAESLPPAPPRFELIVDHRMGNLQAVRDLTGGELLAGWNPKSLPGGLAPGLKVAFYGQAYGCDERAINGPVSSPGMPDIEVASHLTGVLVDAVPSWANWLPLSGGPSCGGGGPGRTGPSLVYLNAADQGGGFGMVTPSGPDIGNRQPFFGTSSTAGIDGHGYNASGMSTFVAFRLAWSGDKAIHPWATNSVRSLPVAKIASRQSVGMLETGEGDRRATAQVKQQLVVALINQSCSAEGKRHDGPCQLQYLLNTALARAGVGVSDWKAFSPPEKGRVWFDKAQGAMPIVAGQLPQPGTLVRDPDFGLPLYEVVEGSTRHGPFENQNFEIRIGLDQLHNALRIVAARRWPSTSPSMLSEEQLRAVWGPRWDDPGQWALVQVAVGQEVVNTEPSRRKAAIGGGFDRIFVGPAP
jgi:hypothetical protein